jgi:hypothetical protein
MDKYIHIHNCLLFLYILKEEKQKGEKRNKKELPLGNSPEPTLSSPLPLSFLQVGPMRHLLHPSLYLHCDPLFPAHVNGGSNSSGGQPLATVPAGEPSPPLSLPLHPLVAVSSPPRFLAAAGLCGERGSRPARNQHGATELDVLGRGSPWPRLPAPTRKLPGAAAGSPASSLAWRPAARRAPPISASYAAAPRKLRPRRHRSDLRSVPKPLRSAPSPHSRPWRSAPRRPLQERAHLRARSSTAPVVRPAAALRPSAPPANPPSPAASSPCPFARQPPVSRRGSPVQRPGASRPVCPAWLAQLVRRTWWQPDAARQREFLADVSPRAPGLCAEELRSLAIVELVDALAISVYVKELVIVA